MVRIGSSDQVARQRVRLPDPEARLPLHLRPLPREVHLGFKLLRVEQMPDLLPNEKVGGICLEGPQPGFQRLSPFPLVEEAHAFLEGSRCLTARPLGRAVGRPMPGAFQHLLNRLNGLGLADVEPAEMPKADHAFCVDDPPIGDAAEAVERAQQALLVEQDRVGGPRRPGISAGQARTLGVYRDGDDLYALSAMGLKEPLPDRQLMAARSPRAPGEEDDPPSSQGVEGDRLSIQGR